MQKNQAWFYISSTVFQTVSKPKTRIHRLQSILMHKHTFHWIYFYWMLLAMVCSLAQLSPILCVSMDCSPSGPSVHGIIPGRILEWVAISSSRGSSRPSDYFLHLLHCRQIIYHQEAQCWLRQRLLFLGLKFCETADCYPEMNCQIHHFQWNLLSNI